MLRPLARWALLIAALTLTACGGGGGGGEGGFGGTPITYSGYFIDAPTQGLAYTASPSGLSGITSATGAFQFRAGDTVTFTLPLGPGKSLVLGSYTPGGTTTYLTVLALANGTLIAQLLQSLDHSSSAELLDVSGLVLPQADVDALAAWLESSGQTLPVGLTVRQMLEDARLHAEGSPVFRQAGPVTAAQALNQATQALDTVLAEQPATNAAAIAQDRTLLLSGYTNYGPEIRLAWFQSSTQTMVFARSTTNSEDIGTGDGQSLFSRPYSINGNTITDSSLTWTLQGSATAGTVQLQSNPEFPYAAVTGAGNYRVLPKLEFAVAGKMLEVTGMRDCPGEGRAVLAFSADGAFWSSYCGSRTEVLANPAGTLLEDGFVNPVAPPEWDLFVACGVRHFMGLLQAPLGAGGQIAMLTAGHGGTEKLGHFETLNIVAAASAPAALQSDYQPCPGPSTDLPASSAYTGLDLSGEVILPEPPEGVEYIMFSGGIARISVEGDTRFAPVTLIADGPGSSHGTFLFQHLPDTGTYEITSDEGCSITNGTGELNGNDIEGVIIDCSALLE